MATIVEKLNSLSLEMESLLDFIASNEALGEDFQNYVEENEIKIEKQSQLNIALIEYLLDGKMQDGTRVLDFYDKMGGKKNENVLLALKNSTTSVFEIKKVLKNAYETYSLTAQRDFCLIPLVKMVNLRGITRGNFIRARVIELEGEFYLLEIYDVISSLNFYKAATMALQCLISNPNCATFYNEEHKSELEKSLLEFKKVFDEKFKNYDKNKIITTNKQIDALLANLNQEGEIDEFIVEPDEYKFFEVAEFKSNEDFVQNAIGGFSRHKETYDVGLFFEENSGLYIVPFLGTFYKIFEGESVEGAKDCIKEFLKSDKVPHGVISYAIKTFGNFKDVVNNLLETNFELEEDILENFKNKTAQGFSPTLVLYNSKVFSDLMGFCEEEAKEKVAPVGRNEPCPCGSGKKFKHCCGKNL